MSEEIQTPEIEDSAKVENVDDEIMGETNNHTRDDSNEKGEAMTPKLKMWKRNLRIRELTAENLKVVVNKVVDITRTIKIASQYKRNAVNLRIQLVRLQETRDRVQHDISDARKDDKEIFLHNVVRRWLINVNETLEEGNNVSANLNSRSFQLSHKATTLEEYASLLMREYSKYVREYLDEYTFHSSFGEIMKAMEDANFQTIGIWALCGVGTTTLSQRVASEAKEDKMFDVVLKVTVPPNQDEKQIQQLLADGLGLKFAENDTMEKRAIQLYERIRKVDRILVILDDIKDEVNLESLGVPIGDDHKGCKVLLTSKTRDVLTSKMGTQKVVQVDRVSAEEVWDLFVKMGGDVVAQDSDVKHMAYRIVELLWPWAAPFLMPPFLKALRNKHVSQWKTSLSSVMSSLDQPIFISQQVQLKESESEYVREKTWGIHNGICSILMFCFNELKSDEAKLLLLFIGCIGSSQISKYHLFLLSMGFGLFSHVDTLQEGRSKLQELIEELKDTYLLMEDQEDIIRMDEAICAGVIGILTFPELNIFSQRIGFKIDEEWPNQSCHLIFKPFSHLNYFPLREYTPELQVLIIGLGDDMNFLEILESYFERMEKLKVLHLRGHFMLPSLDFPKSLTVLSLFGCHLTDTTIFAQLTNLEVLRLHKSNIQMLTNEFGQLHHLRLLDLENSSIHHVIPGVLSMLRKLEELYLGNTNICWGVKDKNNESSMTTLNELGGLNCLTTLDITIRDVQAWPTNLFFRCQLKFRILIEDLWLWDGKDTYQTLKLQQHGNIYLDQGIKALLKVVEHLALYETPGLKNVIYDLNVEGLPNLMSLVLHGLRNLECICSGPQTLMDSFHKLSILKVTYCNKMKNLFSFSIIKMIPQLIEIEVSNCKLMEEILLLKEENANQLESHIVFPCLQSLVLSNLPTLIYFCHKEIKASMSQQSYEKQMEKRILNEINEEHSLFAFFKEKVAFPNLEILYLSSFKSNNLWGDQLFGVTSLTQNLTKLKIEKLGGLKYLFSISMLRCLKKLKHLEIRDCPLMEDIFVMDETMEKSNNYTRDDSNEKIFFPNLMTMIVDSMENLKNMWHLQLATPYSFCKLKKLKIKNCWRLSPVFPTYIVSNLKDLHDLSVDNCNLVKDISYLKKPIAKESAIISKEPILQEQPP